MKHRVFNRIVLAHRFSIVARTIANDDLRNQFFQEITGLDLSRSELKETLDCLMSIDDKDIRGMCIHWLKYGDIKLPDDLEKIEYSYKAARKEGHKNFKRHKTPDSFIEDINDGYVDPDDFPTLDEKVELGDGITIYTIEDTARGMWELREIVDSHWGENYNKWCLIKRGQIPVPSHMPADSVDERGLSNTGFKFYWSERYSGIPKRVAFKYGRLIGMCSGGNGADYGITVYAWWDKKNKATNYIPVHPHLADDEDFIEEYISPLGIDVKDLKYDPRIAG